MRKAVIAGATLAIAVAQAAGPAQACQDASGARCGRDKPARCERLLDDLRGEIGKPVEDVAERLGSRPLRVIRPGMFYTEDYVPDRLNLETDGAGNLVRAWCG